MRIWKYPLAVADVQEHFMPEGAKLLDAQLQHGEPQLWALVDEKAKVGRRKIAIYGTGNPIPDAPDAPGAYVASFQIGGGALVFHVFDLGYTE